MSGRGTPPHPQGGTGAHRPPGDDAAMHLPDDPDTPRAGWLGPWLKGFPALQPPLALADVAGKSVV